MSNAHRASAIAQLVFYTPVAPIALYVGIRAWKWGPRLAWYPAMAFACARLAGGALVIASERDTANTGLLIATIVLLNVGLVPLIMPFHALIRIILEANFPGNKKAHLFVKATRFLLLGAVILLSTAGGFVGKADKANAQSILSKVAYFEFVVVLLSLVPMATWLYFWNQHKIRDGQTIYIKWLLIASPFLCLRAIFGVISVFEAAGANFLTSIWSPMFGNAILFSLMALLPEYIVLCIYIYLGIHRYRTADRYKLVARKGFFAKSEGPGKTRDKGRTSDSIELV